MSRLFIFFTGCILIFHCWAEEFLEADIFRLVNNSVVCTTENDTITNPEACLPCLQIGNIGIGSVVGDIEEKYYNVLRRINNSNNSYIKVYLIEGDNSNFTYLIVNYLNNKAVSIQLTGSPTQNELSFSGISLGDSMEKVKRTLGEPVDIKPVAEISGKMWGYRPYTFNFEFVGDTVYSIAIWKP